MDSGGIGGNTAQLFRSLVFSFVPKRVCLLKTSLRIEKRDFNDNPLPLRVFSNAKVIGRLESRHTYFGMRGTFGSRRMPLCTHLSVAERNPVDGHRNRRLARGRL
jgi:hypothetical protein